MKALGAAVRRPHTVYLVGGTTAVLEGWRDSTIDVDLAFPGDTSPDVVLRALVSIKEALELNVEVSSPAEFIPVPSGWEERSRSIGREGSVTFLHFDLYSQALAKLERGHDRDLEDVDAMLERGLVEPSRLAALFDEIEPELYRFPAIHPPSFRQRVEAAVAAG